MSIVTFISGAKRLRFAAFITIIELFSEKEYQLAGILYEREFSTRLPILTPEHSLLLSITLNWRGQTSLTITKLF